MSFLDWSRTWRKKSTERIAAPPLRPTVAAVRTRDVRSTVPAFLAPALVGLLLAGCLTRPYVGTGAGGAPSPDGRFRLTLRNHGAYGHSYIDRTKKGVRVGIGVGMGWNMTETCLFWHEYKF